jgi:hypothetical protein
MSPALRHVVDEGGALVVRLLAYVGALGLIAISALRLFDGVVGTVGPDVATQLSQLLPPAQSVQPAKPPAATSPGIPVVGVPNLFLRGSL